MYKKHFGLQRRIFRGNAAGPDVFVGPQVAKIVSGVTKALAGTDAVVSVSGPVGSGKSTAVAHALGAVPGKNAIVRVGRFPLQRGELLDLMFDHMRIQQRPPRGNQKLALFRQLLFNLAENDSRMFILVEDAPFLGPELLAELEVVTAADTGPSDGANLILMGDASLTELLKDNTLARLQQRVRLRRKLEPCSAGELGGYLRHSFRRAGGDFDQIFGAGAAEFLHELSGGILRVANNLVESSLEAAAEVGSTSVELSLVSRIADEEFGLTGTFTTPPQIASDKPEPKHSDDATAQLVALSLPDSQAPAAKPEPASEKPAPEPKPVPEPVKALEVPAVDNADADDDIPELIQDTQPALSILPEIPADEPDSDAIQDTLPNLETLSPELAQQAEALKQLDELDKAEEQASKEDGTLTASIPTLSDTSVVSEPPAKPVPQSAHEAEAPPALSLEPESPAPQKPAAEAAPSLDDTPELTIADDSLPIATLSVGEQDDRPEWERDPTLAELRPDLEALERAMAFAHGEDPDAEKAAPEPEPEVVAPVEEEKKEQTLAGLPEITLDDSINRKVDAAEIERRKRQEEETGVVEEDEPDVEAVAAASERKEQRADAEIEKIAAGLAQAKTLEDVDDKMAETLFGEELSIAAAEVAKMVASGQLAEGAPEEEPATAAAPPAEAPPTEPVEAGMEKEFEEVWGEKPDVEVSIESQFDSNQGGLDISASQRLATVRALNTDPNPQGGQAPKEPQQPAAEPEPIEEQITTSMTQTLKALNVRPDPVAVNDDDDDDDDDEGSKKGFFSRFRR